MPFLLPITPSSPVFSSQLLPRAPGCRLRRPSPWRHHPQPFVAAPRADQDILLNRGLQWLEMFQLMDDILLNHQERMTTTDQDMAGGQADNTANKGGSIDGSRGALDLQKQCSPPLSPSSIFRRKNKEEGEEEKKKREKEETQPPLILLLPRTSAAVPAPSTSPCRQISSCSSAPAQPTSKFAQLYSKESNMGV